MSVMLHQPRVLVIDDDENILSAFEEFLSREHCTVVSSQGAEDALVVLSQLRVDLVITDVRMRWQSGVTLLVRIKQSHPSLPVIVITGYPNLISEADIRHYGAAYLFVKPLELDQLRSAVRECLSRESLSKNI
jgi:two-component system, NtrC family, response regulator HydG